MQPHALYAKQTRRAEKHTRGDLFLCILCHSIVLGFAQQTLDLWRAVKKRLTNGNAVFSTFGFSPRPVHSLHLPPHFNSVAQWFV